MSRANLLSVLNVARMLALVRRGIYEYPQSLFLNFQLAVASSSVDLSYTVREIAAMSGALPLPMVVLLGSGAPTVPSTLNIELPPGMSRCPQCAKVLLATSVPGVSRRAAARSHARRSPAAAARSTSRRCTR